ncbi:MAG: hypothetical protein K8T20_00815 [Planctomycetes bacterium]|nr:hypothetical protein [Planctomycetota bacterium]
MSLNSKIFRGQPIVWTRAAAVSCVLIASILLQGCTYIVWGQGGPWPVERNEYVNLEVAAVTESGVLFVRINRKHSDTETWKIEFQRPNGAGEKWTFQKPEPVNAEDFPGTSFLEVHIMTEAEINAHDPSKIKTDASLIVGLNGRHLADILHPKLILADPHWPDNSLWIEFEDPPVAWLTWSTLGHVLVTPVTIPLDVVFFPVWVLLIVAGILAKGGC